MATSSDGGPDRAGGRPRGGGPLAAIRAALPGAAGDRLTLVSGTGQNVLGLAVFVVASFATNVLVARALGKASLGIVTLATQLAFVAGAGTRFGMDMAAVRRVAIDVGKGEPGRARAVLRRSVAIAAVVSLVVALAVAAAAGPLAGVLAHARPGEAGAYRSAILGAALALPFVALTQVYLGGTRGLKIMRHTLGVQWVGQPIAWIALTLALWATSRTIGATVLAYAASWALATVAAALAWGRTTHGFPHLPADPGETRALLRYGAPRAPAALLSQLLFWTDYFVVARYVPGSTLGVYAASVRVAQALVLFLTAVSYMFSPFVADLHERGERERLDGLYKALTRWTMAGTLPVLLLLLIVPGPVLSIFGGGFSAGTTQLRILLIGQTVNVAVGAVGFILIMVGRTGWDLAVYVGSFALDAALALLLAPRIGTTGAAIAQTATLAVSNAARLLLVRRFVGIQPFDRWYARLAVPAAAGGLAMAAVHLALRHAAWPADLLGSAVAGGVAYLAVLPAFGLTPAERSAARRLVSRRAA